MHLPTDTITNSEELVRDLKERFAYSRVANIEELPKVHIGTDSLSGFSVLDNFKTLFHRINQAIDEQVNVLEWDQKLIAKVSKDFNDVDKLVCPDPIAENCDSVLGIANQVCKDQAQDAGDSAANQLIDNQGAANDFGQELQEGMSDQGEADGDRCDPTEIGHGLD
jgi:hypothetical protein